MSFIDKKVYVTNGIPSRPSFIHTHCCFRKGSPKKFCLPAIIDILGDNKLKLKNSQIWV